MTGSGSCAIDADAVPGDYSAYLVSARADARAESEAESTKAAIAREKRARPALPEPRKHAKMHEHERGSTAPCRAADAPRKGTRPPLPARHGPRRRPRRAERPWGRVRRWRLAVGYAMAPGRRTASRAWPTGRPARRAHRHRRAQRARKDHAAAHDRGRAAAARRVRSDRAQRPLGYLAQMRDAIPGGTTVLDAILDTARSPAGRPRASWPGSCSAATTSSRRSASCPAASDRGWSSRCSGGCVEPAAPRRAHQPPRHPGTRGDRDVPARDPATLLIVSHDRRLLETVCERLWVVDDGRPRRSTAAIALAAAVADGWTVRTAAEPRRRGSDGGDGAVPPARARPRRSPSGRAPVAMPAGPAATKPPAAARGRRSSEGRLPAPEGMLEGELAALGCGRSSWSSRWATRGSPPTSLRCAASRASWPTSNRGLAAAEDAWMSHRGSPRADAATGRSSSADRSDRMRQVDRRTDARRTAA